MEFGEQIKQLRAETGLTQEQFAAKLHVSRQAVSNWENDRNLPDLEMLLLMSDTFGVSLDQLIKGGKNMTQKLINDTSETRRAKINMVTVLAASSLMVIGLLCFLIKGFSYEYVDETGLLHENFFLIPVGYLFLLAGLLVLGTGFIAFRIRRKKETV